MDERNQLEKHIAKTVLNAIQSIVELIVHRVVIQKTINSCRRLRIK